MSCLENGLKVTVLTQSVIFFFLTHYKLPDQQFQPLKGTTSIPVRSSMGVPPLGSIHTTLHKTLELSAFT